jgi:FAD/FMN-containing dehydrogenase
VLKLIQDNRHEIESNTPKVTKNSSGYALWDVYNEVENSMDLTKLIVGSQGTLGIVTEITFRLIENPKHSQMAVVLLKDIKDMSLVVGMVKPILPESFEVFDDHTFKISMKFLPQIISRLGGGLLSLGLLFWPEIKLVLTGSIPKIVMLIEFVENTKEELDAKIQQLESVFETWHSDAELHKRIKTHIVQTEREAQKYWVFRRESFNLLRSKLKDVRTAPFIEDVVVRSEDLPEFLPRFEALLDEEKLIYTIAGHVGDGNIHVIPLMNLKDSVQVEQIMRVSDKTYELIKEYHGSLSGEHNDGLIRSPFLQYMFSEKMIEIFSEIKHIFDKKDLFNPHKKIGITWDYAQSKIDRRK